MSTAPVVVIRPDPGLARTAQRFRAAGLPVVAEPLFRVVPTPWESPAPEDVDALLLGSANALRHGGEGLEQYRGLPVYAVGEETAAAARNAGFAVQRVGTGGLQALLDELTPRDGSELRLLRLAGAEHVPLECPAGIELVTRVVYAVEALPLPTPLRAIFAAGAVVLLHSGEAATHFAAECDAASVPRDQVALAALAPRVAQRAGSGWRCVAVADAPNDAALLAAVLNLCKGGR